MRRKRRTGAKKSAKTSKAIGFSEQHFLENVASITGISPVGDYGRDTPLDLTSLESARGSLLLRELFSKYDDGKPSPEKETETWKRFHSAETLCLETNLRFRSELKRDPFWVNVYARIRNTLGEFSWDECAKGFAFGPGATTRLTRANAHAAYKYSGIPESTSGNSVLAQCAIRAVPLWEQSVRFHAEGLESLVRVVPGNRIITVPKSYKTDRTIAKEPCMNIYVQKGIGRVIRRRLLSVGVNLNDQTLNQRAALQGSLDGSLATVDLSMASDTLAFELVSYLLPNDWWWACEQARSPVGTLTSGEVIRYQKFSSMGNGYTFELESLIFWAIAQTVCCRYVNERDSRVKVYGDDIVVPTEFSQELLARLSQAGFKPNEGKTFVSGPYRESCGKHYFLGSDITPFYVRKPVRKLDRLFLVHNNLKRWSDRTGVPCVESLKALRDLAPASWREPRLPDGFGDGAFIGAIDELSLNPHPYGWECWQVDVLQVAAEQLSDNLPVGQLIASLNANSRNVSSAELQRCNSPVFARPLTRKCEQLDLRETLCGLPVKEEGYRIINMTVQRFP
jgi:hypothetical protein